MDTERGYADFTMTEVKGKNAFAKAQHHAKVAEEILSGFTPKTGVMYATTPFPIIAAQTHAQIAQAYALIGVNAQMP